jgi:hypothetical protein
MDAPHTYRWRARADPVNAVWPLVPAILDDEVISSWLVRCALAHDCDATTLTGDVWPDVRFWCADVDRELSSGQLRALHVRSGLSVEILQASTLVPLRMQMADMARFPIGVAPWFLCLGVRNRRRCGGLQYCAKCFEEQIPHYLIQARLAWHTACPIHNVGLLDRCESCDAPLCPHLIVPPAVDLSRCHRCGYELKRAATKPALENALNFQNATDGLFAGPPHLYGQARLLLADWLSLAKWMLGILRAGARVHGPRTDGFFNGLGLSFEAVVAPMTGLPFEYLAPDERADLLAKVWTMIQAGPDRLISLARDEDMRPSLFYSRATVLPAPVCELAAVLRGRGQRHTPQRRAGKPRSPESVLMRWHRLLRKFQR